jgi:hypothetical protein
MSEQHPDLGSEPVEVAYAKDPVEAAMIQGLLENGGIPSLAHSIGIDGPKLGFGALATIPQRVMVRADQAEQARSLLSGALAGGEQEPLAEIANARHLEVARGGRPRGYGLVGAYARIYLWSFGVIALAFGVFLLLHAG